MQTEWGRGVEIVNDLDFIENGLGLINCLHRRFCLSTGNVIASTTAAISISEDFKTVDTLTETPCSCTSLLSFAIFLCGSSSLIVICLDMLNLELLQTGLLAEVRYTYSAFSNL